MNVTKLVGGLAAAVLALAGALGVPGVDSPHVAEVVEKISGSIGMLLTGWLFFRQEWLGQGKQDSEA